MDALGKLFGSNARVRLLRAFLFNPEAAFTAEELATRAAVSSEQVKKELTLLLDAGVIRKRGKNSKASYLIEKHFPHYEALDIFIRSTTGARPQDLAKTFKKIGPVKAAVLSGFFTGLAESPVDLLLVGDGLSERAIAKAVASIEAQFGREVRYAALSTADFRYRQGVYDRLVRDILDYPHRVVVDAIGL